MYKQILILLLFPILCFAHANNISYTDTGSGTPLVLIHAFPTDKTLWEGQLASLKNTFRVITLDLYGFGESTNVDGSAISMTQYADEVKELLDNLHIKRAIIGGESMGGYVALALLQKYPQMPLGLLLANTQSIADNEEARNKREILAQDILKNGTETFINSFIAKAISPNASTATKQKLLQMLKRQTPQALASALRGMAIREDTTDVLATTTLPILIITSDQDAVIPMNRSIEMHEHAKNSKLVVMKSVGHLSNFEVADKWNDVVVKFFSKLNLQVSSVANNKPEKCPSVSTIQAAGFSDINKIEIAGDKWWKATHKSFYDTKQEWTFMELFEEEKGDENPMNTAIDFLNTEMLDPVGPVEDKKVQNVWWCLYIMPRYLAMFAVTPSSAGDQLPNFMH